MSNNASKARPHGGRRNPSARTSSNQKPSGEFRDCNTDSARMARASGLTGRCSPVRQRFFPFRGGLVAVLPLPSASATYTDSEAQHRAGGGDRGFYAVRNMRAG